MINPVVDLHTHTLACGHAYSTVTEVIRAAADKGLAGVGLTEHGIGYPGSVSWAYFNTYRDIPREMFGIRVYRGAEANFMNLDGSIDFTSEQLRKLDLVIVSCHTDCLKPGDSKEAYTDMIVRAMHQKEIDIIGHPDNPTFPVDFDQIAKAAKERHVLLECNNSSYRPGGSREGSRELAKKMLQACKKYGTHVIMGSDAHIDLDVGNHLNSQQVLAAADFPEELVINGSPEAFKEWIRE